MFDLPTILKPNATELDRAIEQAICKGKPDLTPIATLMNPETCPAHLLGWLAWSFSVDIWDAAWSEATKREVIKRSITIHQIKGTAGAVRRALSTIGFRTDISEWFEHGGGPYTFRIDAFGDDIFAGGFQISAELVDMVTLLIENVKPVRAHFTLRIGEKKGGTVTLRTGSLQRAEDHRHITPALPVDTHAPQLSARTGHRGRAVSRAYHYFHMGDAA